MADIYVPNVNYTIPDGLMDNFTDNYDIFTNISLNNASTFSNVPISFLKLAVGDAYVFLFYIVIMIAVSVKTKHPLSLAFVSTITSAVLCVIIPWDMPSKYGMMLITAISFAAGAYELIKR